MITITAVLRTRRGAEATMREALLAVADNVARNEPDTVDFFISQDRAEPWVFTTYERFVDATAMERHNGSQAVARFFAIAQPILDGEVVLHMCDEVSTKR